MNKHFITTTVLFLSVVLGSCGQTTPVAPGGATTVPDTTVPATPVNYLTTANTIQIVTQTTVGFGLTVYGGKDAAEAKFVATQIQTIVSGTIVPYLNGSGGVSTAALNTALKENFISLPPAAQQIITLAGALLDQYLPAPSATTFLSEAQLAYAKAFFTGLSDGAGQFLGNKAAPGIELSKIKLPTQGGTWLNLVPKK